MVGAAGFEPALDGF